MLTKLVRSDPCYHYHKFHLCNGGEGDHKNEEERVRCVSNAMVGVSDGEPITNMAGK